LQTWATGANAHRLDPVGGSPYDREAEVQEVPKDMTGAVDAELSDPRLADIVRKLIDAYQPDRIYLFGSRARGHAGPDSDYDLLVIVADDVPAPRRRSRLAYEVLRGTGVAADVLVWPRSYFESRRQVKASLSATVEREGRLLHVA